MCGFVTNKAITIGERNGIEYHYIYKQTKVRWGRTHILFISILTSLIPKKKVTA